MSQERYHGNCVVRPPRNDLPGPNEAGTNCRNVSPLSDKTFAGYHERSQEYIQADAGLQHRPATPVSRADRCPPNEDKLRGIPSAEICPECGREKRGGLDGEAGEKCYQCLQKHAQDAEVGYGGI